MTINFADIQAMTFDCYGTLIDWEAGIVGALGPLIRERGGRGLSDQELLESYAAAEARLESGPYRPYKEVLAAVTEELARTHGAKLEPGDEHLLAASIARWPAFADTPIALARLAGRFQLIVLSNIDRDLFELTRPHLGSAPLELVAAEDVRSYKPGSAHFHKVLRRLGVLPGNVCHVAQSLYHDIRVARGLGFRTVWVNRRRGKTGSGATPAAVATPDLEVPDLTTLAAMTVVE